MKNSNEVFSVHVSKSALKKLAIGFVALVVACFVFAIINGNNKFNDGIKKDKYQAVFLNSGEAYFGNLSDVHGKYAKLTDVFSVDVNQDLQNQDEGKDAESQPAVSLNKIGDNELHGPEDVMYIATSEIKYWENLKNDSKVVEGIIRFKQDATKKAESPESSTEKTTPEKTNATDTKEQQ